MIEHFCVCFWPTIIDSSSITKIAHSTFPGCSNVLRIKNNQNPERISSITLLKENKTKEIAFKRLAYAIRGWQVPNLQWAGKLETQGTAHVAVQVWRPSGWRNPSCSGRHTLLLFYSGLQLIGQDPPTLRRGNLLHSKPTDLNVNFIQ